MMRVICDRLLTNPFKKIHFFQKNNHCIKKGKLYNKWRRDDENQTNDTFAGFNIAGQIPFSEAVEDPQFLEDVLSIIIGEDIILKELPQTEKEIRNAQLRKYVRLDVWAKDEHEHIYDAEVQREDTKNLLKRSRFYQALLEFFENPSEEVALRSGNERIKRMQRRVKSLKESEEVGVKYMREWEEKIFVKREAREEGLAEGRAEGLAEGCAEGLAEGRAEERERINKLNDMLLEAGRIDDLKASIRDVEFQKRLFEEFGL